MEKTVKSRWVIEKGQWSAEARTYINRSKEEFSRNIKMRIDGNILEFIGGPTGNERYYIADLLLRDPSKHPEMCICGGTINRWPACFVDRQEVTDYLNSLGLGRSGRKR